MPDECGEVDDEDEAADAEARAHEEMHRRPDPVPQFEKTMPARFAAAGFLLDYAAREVLGSS